MSYIIGVLKRNERQNRQTYTKKNEKKREGVITHTQAYKEEK